MQTGLVQERQEFILPSDAYPTLENAFIFRERIERKKGFQLLGRLRRNLLAKSLGNSGASPWSFNIYSTLVPPIVGESNAEIEVGTVIITIGAIVFTDQGNGTLTSVTVGNSGTINYTNGNVVLTHTAGAGVATTINFNYFPGIPVMGLRTRELITLNNEQTIAFDQKYAYRYNNGWEEFIPASATTWTGNNSDFFFTTSYWNDAISNEKLFWETNFSGTTGDPIRYTNGLVWTDFSPQINVAGDKLNQCLAIVPFRSRLMVFNTLEGATLGTSVQYFQRIRWAAIGNPLLATAWRDDIRGKGGFLDIPTSEDIVAIGFVRDNLVIYCERSTWQLKYTGRSIAPFQIEKVNTELGCKSTFSSVQFDTSLVGMGDQGVIECDSYSSKRIDIKIPDLVDDFNNANNGPKRVYGIRNFPQRLAYWIYPLADNNGIFPDRRLVYNYENDSWAIFTDSLTCFGTFQPPSGRTWANTPYPWKELNFTWANSPSLFPKIIAGNQQGFVEYIDQQTTNDVSLSIQGITGFTSTPTVITSVNHNLQTDQVIKITGIPTGTPFANSLNNQIFGVVKVDANNFELWKYVATSGEFSQPQTNPPVVPGTFYVGGGKISVREGFSVVSKKFNSLQEGQSIQLGYIDILMNDTASGAITLNVYIDYEDNDPSNTLPNNVVSSTKQPDTFFNATIPTSASTFVVQGASKNLRRVFCPTRANFITLQYTLSNGQLVGVEQESDVQIDMQILWQRNGGRLGF